MHSASDSNIQAAILHTSKQSILCISLFVDVALAVPSIVLLLLPALLHLVLRLLSHLFVVVAAVASAVLAAAHFCGVSRRADAVPPGQRKGRQRRQCARLRRSSHSAWRSALAAVCSSGKGWG